MPFAATGAYSSMCNTIEAGAVPDPFLTPAVRPTIAVVVNQPSSIALTGAWADGTPIEKLTMVTSSDFDQQWQQAWDTEGRQGSLLACITLPLEEVRAHASAGRAGLTAQLLAISASGQAELDGDVTVSMPLDGDDPPFVDQVAIGSLGEQRQADGTLAPTVHVHYAVTSDTLIPASSALNGRTAKVYGVHEFVENADCSGWANNQQGLARTTHRRVHGRLRAAHRERAHPTRHRGRRRSDARPRAAGRLAAASCACSCSSPTTRATASRWRCAVHRCAARSRPSTTWAWCSTTRRSRPGGRWRRRGPRSGGNVWCGPATLDPAQPGALVHQLSRAATPDGITVTVAAVDDTGTRRPAFVVVVPVNSCVLHAGRSVRRRQRRMRHRVHAARAMPVDPVGDESVVVVAAGASHGNRRVVARAGAHLADRRHPVVLLLTSLRQTARVLPRLIATDLDGTLLDPSGVVSERTAAALQAATAAGIVVVFASGRPPFFAAREIEAVGSGVQYGVMANGTVVCTLPAGEVLHTLSFHASRGPRAAVNAARAHDPAYGFALATDRGFTAEDGFHDRMPVHPGGMPWPMRSWVTRTRRKRSSCSRSIPHSLPTTSSISCRRCSARNWW